MVLSWLQLVRCQASGFIKITLNAFFGLFCHYFYPVCYRGANRELSHSQLSYLPQRFLV